MRKVLSLHTWWTGKQYKHFFCLCCLSFCRFYFNIENIPVDIRAVFPGFVSNCRTNLNESKTANFLFRVLVCQTTEHKFIGQTILPQDGSWEISKDLILNLPNFSSNQKLLGKHHAHDQRMLSKVTFDCHVLLGVN